ncbi:MAG TPA: BadF/BadG/BcrA/BcrD ATPase family protein [Solirubrobacteraceae bacterium]|nr:BadF/BadG/BcrA/BcrD ATPase family protein [Solirubrobacteraceae bacterium]
MACKYPAVDRTPLVTLPPALAGFEREPRSDAHPRYLLGVDGGATKTLAAVLDLQRGSIHLGHGGPSNQDAVGVQAAGRALFDAADHALAGAGINDGQLAAAVLAVAGTDTPSVVRHVRAERSPDWIVVGDVVGAWATATDARPGVGVIAGTGSNVLGVGPDGRAWRAGGWGHLLGDEGSGYWLGLQSIRAALRDREASGPETALSDAAVEFFGAPTIEALAASVYSKPLTKGEIAAFAVETAAHAQRGDAVARRLYEEGARELAQQIAAVIHQTGLEGEFPVGLIGSAYKAGAIFIEPLARAIHAVAPGADVHVVEMAPVGGALLLAARACRAEQALAETDLAALIDAALPRR